MVKITCTLNVVQLACGLARDGSGDASIPDEMIKVLQAIEAKVTDEEGEPVVKQVIFQGNTRAIIIFDKILTPRMISNEWKSVPSQTGE